MSKNSAAKSGNLKYPTFESAIEVIDKLLEMNRHRWQLSAISSMDYSDVAQIIRLHLWKKFYQYDEGKGDISPWINRIIINQIKNLRRNVYDNMSRPCLRCPENQGGELCAIYGVQSNSCELFKKWEKTKKHAHDVKMTVSAESHIQEMFDMPYEHNDLGEMEKSLHLKMKQILKPMEYKIYKFLFMDGLSDEEAAKKLNYSGEKNKKTGLNNLIKIKKLIIIKVKKILEEGIDS